jgi:hypothetical protein
MIDDEKYVDPKKIDIMLNDFSEKEAAEVSKKTFLFELNSATIEPPTFPIEGIIWGDHKRMLVPIVVSHGKAAVKTLALYDGGSGSSFLCENTLRRLGITDGIASTMNISMHGKKIPVHLSHDHFKDINVIGQSFFASHEATVLVEYKELKFSIYK